ncbi:hypothetical protein [Streptomyces salinarius]|uniref:hypothetical protein n=1 Tax=Streptomyces salinarius TaxID=2762598 RepID=UPI0028528D1A|nr:hypothetical protein [Streptomyces salinarius]
MARVTPRGRALLAAGGVVLAGLTLTAGILTDAIAPDDASAIGTVGAATAAGLALVWRRQPPSPPGGGGDAGIA